MGYYAPCLGVYNIGPESQTCKAVHKLIVLLSVNNNLIILMLKVNNCLSSYVLKTILEWLM